MGDGRGTEVWYCADLETPAMAANFAGDGPNSPFAGPYATRAGEIAMAIPGTTWVRFNRPALDALIGIPAGEDWHVQVTDTGFVLQFSSDEYLIARQPESGQPVP
jgi:hypothetical protein